MSQRFEINYGFEVVYVINNESGEYDGIYLFKILDNIEKHFPEFRDMPNLYNAWLYYHDVINKPLPALEKMMDKITAEKFEECVGSKPENDDLERCNCNIRLTNQ